MAMEVSLTKYALGLRIGLVKSTLIWVLITKPKSNNLLLISPRHSCEIPIILAISFSFKLESLEVFFYEISSFNNSEIVMLLATIGAKTNASPSE